MKTKDVFELPVKVIQVCTGDKPSHMTPDVMMIAGRYLLNGTECGMVENAINNHDKLTEENARLRESLLMSETAMTNALLGDTSECESALSLVSELLELLKGDL